MKYTVVWLPSAEDELAEIFNNAEDKQEVTDAANCFDLYVKNDADQKGQEFYGDRILVIEPLTFVFSVSPDDCLVSVLQVH